jgi:hypothetical protein
VSELEDLDRLDPATLPPEVRGRLRAVAATSPDPAARDLARRMLDPSERPRPTDDVYARGAARAEAINERARQAAARRYPREA